MKDRIKKIIKVIFGIPRYPVSGLPGILATLPQAPKNEQEVFNALYERIRERSLLTKERLFTLYQLVKYASGLDGDMAEVGVCMGGSAKLIAETSLNKNIYLIHLQECLRYAQRQISVRQEILAIFLLIH